MAIDVGSAIGHLDIDISRFLSGLETALSQTEASKNKIETLGKKISGVGDKFESVGSSLTKKVTTPIVGLGTVAITTATNFESAMSTVAAISGSTGDDLDALTDKAKEMGATTKFSASEAAEAFQYMAMAGWKTEDMLSGIEGVLSLAAASGEDLGTTSDIVTDALTAFGLTAADTARFSDVLAAASSNANTNVSMMGETFKYAAPIAGSLGYSIEDTAEAIGLMANSGIKGSQAGTTLRTIMTKLSGEIEICGEQLGEFTIQTTNSDGSMRDFNDILADCRTAFSQLTESEQASVASSLVGQEAMSGFLSLMNAAPADIEKLRTAIQEADGTAQAMAGTMQDNLSGQLTILKSTLESLAISFGELMLPVIKDMVSGLQNLLTWINNLDEGQKKTIITIATIVAVVGPVLLVLGKLVSGVGSVITVIGKASSLFGGFANVASTAATPIDSAGKSTKRMAAAAKNLVAAGAGILLAATGMALLAQSAIALADAGLPAVGCMILMVGAMAALGAGALYLTKTTASVRGLSKASTGLLAMGASIILVATGFAILAQSSIALAEAGWPAIAVMGGLVGAIALLAVGAAAVGPALTAGAVGLVAFGGAIALVGVGILAATSGVALLATQLPTISAYGSQAAIALVDLGTGMVALGAGATVAGTGLTVAGVGLTAVAVGAAAAGVGVTALGVGVLVLAAGAVTLGVGLTLCGAGLVMMAASGEAAATGMNALAVAAAEAFIPISAGAVSCGVLDLALISLMIPLAALTVELAASAASCGLLSAAMGSTADSVKIIQNSASSASKSLSDMVTAVDVAKAGLEGLGDSANAAAQWVVDAFTEGGPKASSAAKTMATSITNGLEEGLEPIPGNTTEAMNSMNKAVDTGMTQALAVVKAGCSSIASNFRGLSSQSYTWGADMMLGLIRGINSKMGSLRSAVNTATGIIYSNLHFSRPDEGPLRNYETWMPDFMDGLAKGINSNLYKIEGAVGNVADKLVVEPEYSNDGMFSAAATDGLQEYNITLVNTVELYRQLAEQLRLCSVYSLSLDSRDNGLLRTNNRVETPVPQETPNRDNQESRKPDQLVIPITIGEEHIETVVVDLLRREVRM